MTNESPKPKYGLRYIGERQAATFITLTIGGRRNFNLGDIVFTDNYKEVVKAVNSKMFEVVKQPEINEGKSNAPAESTTETSEDKPKVVKTAPSKGKNN